MPHYVLKVQVNRGDPSLYLNHPTNNHGNCSGRLVLEIGMHRFPHMDMDDYYDIYFHTDEDVPDPKSLAVDYTIRNLTIHKTVLL